MKSKLDFGRWRFGLRRQAKRDAAIGDASVEQKFLPEVQCESGVALRLAPQSEMGPALLAILLLVSLPGLSAEVGSPRVPREVLAAYYGWYGSPEKRGHAVHWGKVNADAHEIADSAHYPVGGIYDSGDPAVIDRQIDLARASGITVFMATWWGQKSFADGTFPVLLERAAKKNFKVTPYWEKAPGSGREQIEGAVGDLVYLLTRYATNTAFLRVNGKPVIFVYARVLDQVPAAAWPEIIREARTRAGDFVLIADGFKAANAQKFQGLHAYNISWAAKDKPAPEKLRGWASGYYSEAVNLARRHGIISCLPVIPGYDDTKVRRPGRNADRQDGQVYRALWEEAAKADPDWILIVSWNEWHEGSEIEPSVEYGERYTTLTGEYARRFLAGGARKKP